MGRTAAGTLGTGEGTVKLKSNVGSISIRSKAAADKPAKVQKTSSLPVVPTVVTGQGSRAAAVRAGEGSVKVETR